MKALRAAAERLAAGVDRLEKDVAGLSSEAEGTLVEARKTLVAGRKVLAGKDAARLVASAERAARALEETLGEARRFLAETKGTLRRSEYDLLPLVQRLSAAAESVQRLSNMLEMAPDALMWGRPRSERRMRVSGKEGPGR